LQHKVLELSLADDPFFHVLGLGALLRLDLVPGRALPPPQVTARPRSASS